MDLIAVWCFLFFQDRNTLYRDIKADNKANIPKGFCKGNPHACGFLMITL